MEKVYLTKIEQNGITFYSFVWNTIKLNKLRHMYKPGEVQDIQRPYIESKVRDISAYVAGKTGKEGHSYLGLIPNSPIIVFKDKIVVRNEQVKETYEDGSTDTITKYYVMLPSTPEELAEYTDAIQIIDGQHRIIAFDEKYIDSMLEHADKYQMNFIAFTDVGNAIKKELFMTTNEKQDRVKTNLLIYIKKDLGLLPDELEFTYEIVDFLNRDSNSPLFGRIMFGAEKIKKGYQETQVSKILEKYGANEFFNKNLKMQKEVGKTTYKNILINYLKAWQEATGFRYSNPGTETFCKISGIRYIMRMFGDICDDLKANNLLMTKENFLSVIKLFPAALQLENVKSVFGDDTKSKADGTKDDNEKDGLKGNMQRSFSFRSEGGTTALAKQDIYAVLNYKKMNSNGDGYKFL
jgi:DGQHR domain-containing protein